MVYVKNNFFCIYIKVLLFIRYLYVKNTYYYENVILLYIEAHVNKNIIFVPHWICEVLKRNNCSLREVLNYDVLRKYVSLDDMSGLLGFQQTPEIARLKLSSDNSLLSKWESSAVLTRSRPELDSVVVPMSHSKEKEVVSRLLKSGYDTFDEGYSCFAVTDVDRDNFLVIMNPGFMDEIKNPEVFKKIVTKLLSQSYVYCRIDEVSKTPIFKTYVDLLEVSTLSN